MHRPDDGTPFKITPHQLCALVIDRQTIKLHQRQADDRLGRVAYPDEMVEQRRLPALESLDEKRPTQIIQIAVGLGAEGLLKGQALGKTGIDLVGIHVLAEHDADAFDPVQRTTARRMSSAIRNEKLAAHQ